MDIVGTVGDDTLVGGPDADYIQGLGGNDTLAGNGGDDRLEGGSGDDVLDGGDGNDRLFGGDGIDRFIGGSGNNYFSGNLDDDVADYSAAPSAIHVRLTQGTASNGYGGTDSMAFIRNIVGSSFNDVMEGTGSLNHLQGGDGNDLLDGLNGDDLLEGGDGDDILVGGDGWDTLIGGEGDDQLDPGVPSLGGGPGRHLLDGGEGDDVLSVISGPATLVGGSGNDTYRIGTAAGLIITELAGEGIDTVEVGGGLPSFTLAVNLENLSHVNLNAFTGVGNELDNVMTGGDGTETFSGLGGENVIDGGGARTTRSVMPPRPPGSMSTSTKAALPATASAEWTFSPTSRMSSAPLRTTSSSAMGSPTF